MKNYLDCCVIASCSDMGRVDQCVEALQKMGYESINTFPPMPEGMTLSDAIDRCFRVINDCDFVVAVTKPDGTFGEGVTYEIVYAKMQCIPVLRYWPEINPSNMYLI